MSEKAVKGAPVEATGRQHDRRPVSTTVTRRRIEAAASLADRTLCGARLYPAQISGTVAKISPASMATMNPTVDVAEEVHRLDRRIFDSVFEHASRLTVTSNSRDGKLAVGLHFSVDTQLV